MLLGKHAQSQGVSQYPSVFVVPAFPRKLTLSVDDFKASRSHVFGFAVTNKVEGATFKAVLGLRRLKTISIGSYSKWFCSLLCLCSSVSSSDHRRCLIVATKGLRDFNDKSHTRRQETSTELVVFSNSTLASWTL